MGERGTDYLRIWIERNVTDANRNGSQVRALALAVDSIADAASVGISLTDLEPTWGSIESIFHEAMRNDIETMHELWNAFTRAREKDALS